MYPYNKYTLQSKYSLTDRYREKLSVEWTNVINVFFFHIESDNFAFETADSELY